MGILQQHTASFHTIANLCRTTHVVIVVTNCWKRYVSVESLCVAQKTQCDTERSTCADNSGTAHCQCLQGYYKHNPDDLSCLGRCASPQTQGVLVHRSIQLLTVHVVFLNDNDDERSNWKSKPHITLIRIHCGCSRLFHCGLCLKTMWWWQPSKLLLPGKNKKYRGKSRLKFHMKFIQIFRTVHPKIQK